MVSIVEEVFLDDQMLLDDDEEDILSMICMPMFVHLRIKKTQGSRCLINTLGAAVDQLKCAIQDM
jgi:hypothetical protein